MSESVNEELNRIKSNIVNTYNTLSDVGLINEGGVNSDNLADTVKNLSWGGGELCDIGLALFIDESAGMRRLLNGQILNIESKYKPFLNKLQLIATAYPNILCTETEWQAIKESSPFGQVGKFVLNYGETVENIVSVRLPAVVNLQGLQDLQYLGDKLDETLPNIKGSFALGDHSDTDCKVYTTNLQYGDGPFYSDEQSTNNYNGSGASAKGNIPKFDASRCSSAYKNNAHVQQEAIQYPYYIQVNLTEYNHMIDVGLVNELKERVYLVESWNEQSNWYRIYSDGWCEQGGYYQGTLDTWDTQQFYVPYSFKPTVIIQRYSDSTSDDSSTMDKRYNMARGITTTGFNAWGKWAGYPFIWEAKGYIEL